MTSDVTFSNLQNLQQKTLSSSQSLANDFDDFLNLLTTQLQNQDPLSPMDTAEFTNQLVAFAGVEQSINTNQKLDTIVGQNLANAFASSLDYVGLIAKYVSSEVFYDGSTPVEVNYALDGEATEARFFVSDTDGRVLYEQDVSDLEGVKQVTWDGTNKFGLPVPPGTYNVAVEAVDHKGNPVNATTVVSGRINGVETQNGQIFTIVGERAVAVSDIINVSEPKNTTEESGDGQESLPLEQT